MMTGILKQTILIYAGIFIIALVIIFFKAGLKKSELWLRYFSWVMIVPLILITDYFGKPVFHIFMGSICCLCLKEYFTMTHLKQLNIYRWEGRIFALLIFFITILERKDIFYIMPIFVIMIVLSSPLLIEDAHDALKESSITVTGILYFGWFFGHICLLRDKFGFGSVIFLVSSVVLSDIFAYTFGKLWGKKKLIPNISPHKTVFGSYAAIIGGMLAAIIFKFSLNVSILFAITLGFIIGVFSQIGDLVISVMKRDYGVKDSGALIPGHGGILDRADSLIFCIPIFYYLLFIYFEVI